jgi:hypothetical protein
LHRENLSVTIGTTPWDEQRDRKAILETAAGRTMAISCRKMALCLTRPIRLLLATIET